MINKILNWFLYRDNLPDQDKEGTSYRAEQIYKKRTSVYMEHRFGDGMRDFINPSPKDKSYNLWAGERHVKSIEDTLFFGNVEKTTGINKFIIGENKEN